MSRCVIRIGLFWTGAHLSTQLDPEEWLTVFGIRWFSRTEGLHLAEVCHMGVAFEFDDGSREIHEALFREGWRVKPFDKLEHFKSKDPQNVLILEWLDCGPEALVQSMYERSQSWVGMHYDNRLIGTFAITRSLLGRSIGISMRDDPLRLVCSEGASRLIFSGAPYWDFRPVGSCKRTDDDDGFECVTPQDALNRFRCLKSAKLANLEFE